MINKIKKELLTIQDRKYKDFSTTLLPGINNVLGVRLPILRKMAKEIAKSDYTEFFLLNDGEYFELTMLEGMLIGNLKLDFDMLLNYIEKFIPKINCWSICDSFCCGLKAVKKNKEKMKIFLKKYFNSKKEYELRFAYVILIFYYMDDIDYVISKIKNFKSEDYYAKMAVAWCLAECFVRDFDKTFEAFDTLNLSNWVYKKAVTKALESFRIDKRKKNILRELRTKC